MEYRKKIALYMTGQGITLIGSSVVSFAMSWYIALETNSGLLLGLMIASIFVPQAIMLPFGGSLADRYNPKKIAVFMDLSIAGITLILAVLFGLGMGNIPLLIGLNACRSLLTGLELPSAKSILPMVVPEEKLYHANSIFTGIWCLGQLIAPGISGVVMAAFPFYQIFLVDVMTAIIGVVTLLFLPVPFSPKEYSGVFLKTGFRETGTYLKGNKTVKRAILVYGSICFLTAPAGQLIPLLVTRNLGAEIWILSGTEIAFAIGSISLSTVMSIKKISDSMWKLVRCSLFIFGATMLLLPFLTDAKLFLCIMLLMGFASPLYYTPLTTMIQTDTSEAYMGRVMSVAEMVQTLAIPAGTMVAGLLTKCSLSSAFLIFGIIMILMVVILKSDVN